MNIQLFEILKQSAGVTEENLKEAQKLIDDKGGSISDLLIKRKIITEKQLLEALSIQYDIPFQPVLPLNNIRNDFTQRVPIQFLKKYVMVPLGNNIGQPGADDRRAESTDALSEIDPEGNAAYIIAINDPVHL